MLRVSTLLVAFCIVLFGAQACSVTMWTDQGLTGESQTWSSNVSDLPSTYARKISSFQLSNGCGMTVYKEAGYTGVLSFFEGQTLNLDPYGFNDAIVSFQLHDLRTIECGVVLYSDQNFGGDAQLYVANGFPSSFSYGDFNGIYHNDYYSSLRIVGYNAKRCAVVAWENSGLRGQNRYFGDANTSEFGDFNDRISSIEIVSKNACAVVFYSDSVFRGNARYYTMTHNSLEGQNDLFSSMKLLGSHGCKVIAFKDNNMPNGQATLTYHAPKNEANFPNGWNDVISSFEIGTSSMFFA